MRVAMASAGTEGDLQPLLAIGRGLRARGHQVRFGAVPVFHDLVRGSGLEPVALGDYDPRRVVLDIARSNPRQGRLATLRQRLTPMVPDSKLLAQYLGLCGGVDAVIHVPISGYAYHAAEAHGIPAIEVQLLPLTPTRAFPCPLAPVPAGAASSLVNLFSYHAVGDFFWLVNRDWVNDWRKRMLGLRPISLAGPPATPFFREKRRVICAISPAVVRKPREWPEAVELTGYLFAPSAYSPPDELVAFLEQGVPPVCVSFGSTVESDPTALRPILLEAQRQTRRRMIVVKGWANYELPERSEDFFILDRASYAWLYPRVATVVHHAGTGTAAEAVRAGVPSVCVPFITEQRFWATRLADLGVSPRPIPRRRLTASLLADAIAAASDEPIAVRARALGTTVRDEDGVSAAVHAVERALG